MVIGLILTTLMTSPRSSAEPVNIILPPPGAARPATTNTPAFPRPAPSTTDPDLSGFLRSLSSSFASQPNETYPTDTQPYTGKSYGPGSMDKCTAAPDTVRARWDEAMKFREQCPLAKRGDNQKIAISDYSSTPPVMYLFDTKGTCLGHTLVAYGNGGGGRQVACSDANSHETPPGFHLTAFHDDGGEFNSKNCLGLVGLEGQGTSARGVLIHPAQAPGTPTTWGCSGVSYNAINAVKTTLGEGALVYNYFPPDALAPNCKSRAGMSHSVSCQPDPSSPKIPAEATGTGTPTVQ